MTIPFGQAVAAKGEWSPMVGTIGGLVGAGLMAQWAARYPGERIKVAFNGVVLYGIVCLAALITFGPPAPGPSVEPSERKRLEAEARHDWMLEQAGRD